MKQTPKSQVKPHIRTRTAVTARPNQRRYRTLITHALAESDRKYKLITDSSPSAILAYDLRGRLLYANPAVEDLTGYSVNELEQLNFINWFHPDDQARMLSIWDKAFEGGKFVEEFRLVTKDNQIKWCSSVGDPLCDENGKPIGVLERARDITERKRAEFALRASQANLTALIENMHGKIWSVDTNYRLIIGNSVFRRAMAAVLGRAIETGESALVDVFEPAFSTQWKSYYDRALSGERFSLVLETQRSAMAEYTEYSFNPILGVDGQVVGATIFGNDISERKRADQALFRNEQQYRLLFQHSPIGILHYDTDLQITDCNDRFSAILQTTRARLIGLDMNTLRDQNVLPALRRALTGEEGVYEGFYRATTSTAEIWVSMRTAPLFDENAQVKGGIAIVEDVTARHHTEEQVRAALREKEVLLKEIHHRVKNNLNVVCGLLNLQTNLASDALHAPLEESQKRIHAMALIHEKLYQSSDLARVNIGEYIGDLVDHLHVAYARANSPQVNIEVDDVRLDLDTAMACGMIVNELATNAFKYAFPPGVTSHARAAPQEIRVALKHTDHRITFTISDNGIGLPPSLDWRHAQSLGLQLAHMFTEQLGGALELDTTAGTRWTITFAMPHAEQEGTR